MATMRRDDVLEAIARTTYDVLVIGAGMTGAGVALDAASRGLKVALVDQGDFASGTSSKSSKMVHGGLRYLQQKEFRLVYENLRERQRLLENAPFLIRPLPFLIPLFAKNGVVSKALVKGYSTALRIYDLSGGWRIGQRYRKITRQEALAHLPTLNVEHLVAGFLYMDARGDDARVALTLAKTAALDFGADVANYLRADQITFDGSGRVSRVRLHDSINASAIEVATRSVVNATGVWADEIFTMVEHRESHRITPAKGIHISVERHRMPADVAAVLSVPGDRRSIFVVPFEEAPFTFIGTTDTAYEGALDNPGCTPEDVAYLLNAVNASTSSNLVPDDVTGVWAGLRPLLAPDGTKHLNERTADLSRRHQVTDTHDGIIHVTGGKWTTYRQMAEDAVEALLPYVGRVTRVKTKSLRLHGYGQWRPTSELERHLYGRYGDEALAILELIRTDPALGEPVVARQPYVGAEFVYAASSEMALNLEDLLTRRARAYLHDARATVEASRRVAVLVAPVLGWDDAEVERQVRDFESMARKEFAAAGLTL